MFSLVTIHSLFQEHCTVHAASQEKKDSNAPMHTSTVHVADWANFHEDLLKPKVYMHQNDLSPTLWDNLFTLKPVFYKNYKRFLSTAFY